MNENKTFPVIGFIGAGNMAAAIIGGLVAQGYPADRIWATNRSAEKNAALTARCGIQTSCDNHAVVRQSDVLVLAVKPQALKALAQELRPTLAESGALVISVAAGIVLESLQQWLGEESAIVRCMPNTPSLVLTGASGLYANDKVSTEQRDVAERILGSVGLALWVDTEAQLEAVTAVSGSGPAYFFRIIEAMSAAGEALGLSEQVSRQLSLQTAMGAAKMALESDVDAGELRRRVSSPNGTTERALQVLEEGQVGELFQRAMQACAARAHEMGEELGR